MKLFAEFCSLPLDVRVNIILCILSFCLALLSIAFVVCTLRQNSKMLKASTRPYLSAYIKEQNEKIMLIIKNFGNSSALITGFESTLDFSKFFPSSKMIPFEHLVDSLLAPGQSISCGFDYETFVNSYDEFQLIFQYIPDSPIKCRFMRKHKIKKATYTNKINISVTSFREVARIGCNPKNGNELTHIAKSLHSIDLKLLDR